MMKLEGLDIEVTPLPGAMKVYRAEVDAPLWTETARRVREQGGRLIALWGDDARETSRGFIVRAALAARDGLIVISLPVSGDSCGRSHAASDVRSFWNRREGRP
jgi:hypothetical protein